jgi:hypothetical protein
MRQSFASHLGHDQPDEQQSTKEWRNTMPDQLPTSQDARPSSDIASPDEKAMVDFAKKRRQSIKWLIGIGLAFLALIICCVFGFFAALPTFSEVIDTAASKVTDEGYVKLLDALSKRTANDESISSASADFTVNGSDGEVTDVWLVIDIAYTGTCDSTTNNACEALVDEFARIVFDNYPGVDELAGIEVSITNQYNNDFIDLSITSADKALTIAEWRKELSIEQ